MGSTGLYGLDLAFCVDRTGVALMVANSRAVRHLAQAMMKRSKTDRPRRTVKELFSHGGGYFSYQYYQAAREIVPDWRL